MAHPLILLGGVVLCALSGSVLRFVWRARGRYERALREQGIQDVPMLPAELLMTAAWATALLIGLGLVGWGLSAN